MNQAVMIINCYLYGATAVMLLVLVLIVYLRGQVNHFPNPFAKKNLVYRHPAQAKGVLFGKKFGLLAYSPEQDEGHILVLGPSGTGKTSALLIPTLRSWQGTALVVDISGDISANVNTPNKIVFDPTSENCIPYDVFASINEVTDDTERQERLEQLAYLLLPDKANDSEASIFFTKNGRKMITAALICYYGMDWGFVEICEFFLGHDWRSLLNDIAKQQNPIANMFISSFAGASEQNTAGCKQAADDAPNEDVEDANGMLGEENSDDTSQLDASSRDFLESAIKDYNALFKTHYDTSADRFQNYYKDLSLRMKNREVDILIVVNMFLTGFDATTLNTLWVDKNLVMHGLIQAFSRTNRILNSVKTYGNIVCFRNLEKETNDALALFGDREAGSVVLLKNYKAYYEGYDEDGKHHDGYEELIAKLQDKFPLGQPIVGEQNQKDFIALFGAILRMRNILTSFDDFAGNELLAPRDMQDYQSRYLDLYHEMRPPKSDKEVINDDIVFEMELIRQVEINIDYILMLVAKYHDSNCEDKEILVDIRKAVDSSMQLRSKKDLIENFIATVNTATKVDDDWIKFVTEQKKIDLDTLIAEEKLKPDETRKFVDNSFRDGILKTTGTDVDRILPPVSRFGGGNRAAKKDGIIAKLQAFFDKYFGLI